MKPSTLAHPVINPDAGQLRSTNAVMSGRGRRPHHVDDLPGPLSIKFMVRGCGAWRTSAGVHVVEDGHFLVLNHGETYSLSIDGGTPRESFCPFFAPGFVEDVERSLTSGLAALLDGPATGGAPASFLTHLHDRDRRVVPALFRLRDAHEPLTLADLAGQAPLSPYHFHRLFRAIYGMPPLHYLRNLRLARARRLLRDSDLPVTEVALAVGFESPAAFTTRFARSTGLAPSRYRRRFAAGGIRKIDKAL